MANAKLYYVPEPGAGLVTLDLGHSLAAASIDSTPRGSYLQTRSGRVLRSARGGSQRVQARLDGITDLDVVARLRTFERAAESGAIFGLTADHDRTWGGYALGEVPRGASTIRLSTPLTFAGWGAASPTIAAGDYVAIESGWPGDDYEEIKVSAISGGLLTLAWPTVRSHPGRPLVRWVGFWPHLAIEPGQLLTDRVPGVVYDLRLNGSQAVQSRTGGRRLGTAIVEAGIGDANNQKPGTASPWDLQQSSPSELGKPTTRRQPLGGRLGGKGS